MTTGISRTNRRAFRSGLLAMALTVATASVPAHAALTDRGGGLIYDSDRNITWLANVTYGAGSSYDDGPLNNDGLMSWQHAVDWAAALSYLDTVRGVTYTDWRLPTTLQPDGTCDTHNGGAFDSGINCTGSEMGHLFYGELGGTAYSSVLDSGDPDLALFTNIQLDGNWSGRSFDTSFAWVFNYRYGLQGLDNKTTLFYAAWAVRDGDVVPVPAAAWLFGSALGLLGFRRAGAARQTR